jgi:hypothetical protein
MRPGSDGPVCSPHQSDMIFVLTIPAGPFGSGTLESLRYDCAVPVQLGAKLSMTPDEEEKEERSEARRRFPKREERSEEVRELDVVLGRVIPRHESGTDDHPRFLEFDSHHGEVTQDKDQPSEEESERDPRRERTVQQGGV